jgi:hypothetical protein
MIAYIYLNDTNPDSLLATVDMEVCLPGIYQIDGVEYELTGQHKFVIDNQDRGGDHHLHHVELVVQKRTA